MITILCCIYLTLPRIISHVHPYHALFLLYFLCTLYLTFMDTGFAFVTSMEQTSVDVFILVGSQRRCSTSANNHLITFLFSTPQISPQILMPPAGDRGRKHGISLPKSLLEQINASGRHTPSVSDP